MTTQEIHHTVVFRPYISLRLDGDHNVVEVDVDWIDTVIDTPDDFAAERACSVLDEVVARVDVSDADGLRALADLIDRLSS